MFVLVPFCSVQGVKCGEAVLAVRRSGLNAFLIRKPFTRKTAFAHRMLVFGRVAKSGRLSSFWAAESIPPSLKTVGARHTCSYGL